MRNALKKSAEHEFPSGGPLKLDSSVGELIQAHLAAICAPDESVAELALTRKRDDILAAMNSDQRDNLYVVSIALTRLSQRKR